MKVFSTLSILRLTKRQPSLSPHTLPYMYFISFPRLRCIAHLTIAFCRRHVTRGKSSLRPPKCWALLLSSIDSLIQARQSSLEAHLKTLLATQKEVVLVNEFLHSFGWASYILLTP